MPQECGRLATRLGAGRSERIGPREFLRIEYNGLEVVLVISLIGKVAAATTATLLVDRFGVDAVVFTGVAGGVGPAVAVGDILIADSLVQHDLDLKGVLGFSRFEVPSLKKAHIAADVRLSEIAVEAAQSVIVDDAYCLALRRLGGGVPAVRRGVIASGDRFVNDSVDRRELVSSIAGLMAVEMEGAAVAQVCAEHEVPLVVSRIISDSASDSAGVDFVSFIDTAAALGSERFVLEFIERIRR